ncbi:alpha/beta fold hydrolase [Stutzerimonas azotifigens]|uniref:alpha/beta fold hydrolase n=1 Tax=Stutzerimonas azotifigens TaxID=291995 RepID=UPI00041EB510|nr:alpha/beta hydrolase [Stutzerimonas azotifigens]
MSQTLFFAHANGFPSGTYRKLFEALAPDFRIECLDRHGHDPRFPVEDNWQRLVDELIHHLAGRAEPVIGVGHSLGGVLHYHAALRRPELYRGVVMLDSPVVTWADQTLVWLAKRLGFIDRLTPAGRTEGRRECFPDLARARDYFAGKTLFRSFDPDCLEAYLEHGLAPDGEQLRLRFEPEIEMRIYRSFPHRTPGWPIAMKVPLALVRGRRSRVILPHHGWLVRLMPAGQALEMSGGHMFPLERPQQTAEMIRQLCLRWTDAPLDEEYA